MQREKFVVLFTVFVDVIGVGIVIPILPFYVGSFGASPFVITLLFASFAFFAFLSSPFLGALSDKIGRRPVLIASITSTAIGWFVFAGAGSLPFLFLGRIIDGAAAGNFTVAQGCLVDLARDEKERSSNLGLIGAAFGTGFMVGPILGGALSTVSHSFPFWCSGILAAINAMLAYFFLPETHKRRDSNAAISFNPLAPLARAAFNKTLRPLFLSWLFFAIAMSASQSVFALYVLHAFNFGSFQTGLIFAATGVFAVLNQTVLLRRMWLKYFTESQLELLMTVILGVSFLLMGSDMIALFFVGLPLFATGQSVQRVVLTSEVTGKTNPLMKGEALGILTSIMAASMIVGPIAGGALFEIHDGYPFFLGAALMIFSLIIALQFRRSPDFHGHARVLSDKERPGSKI
ncbi:MAG: MFS transporter [Ignavibacteriales bacterium]|nr:MFS transporter [Ignavibacteriales bacterium]